MTRNQISVRQKGVANRRQPLIATARFAEVAGVTTAECAAVACCCPCGLLNLILLALYKVPTGLYKRARRRKRQMLMRKGVLPLSSPTSFDAPTRRRWGSDEAVVLEIYGRKVETELLDLEKEMRERFFSSGFWRSPSESDT